MGLFRRNTSPEPLDLNAPVDDEAARRAAAYVNAGKVRKASRVCDKTDNPRATAFAAFRYIDCEDVD